MSAPHSTAHIFQSLFVNIAIACIKAVAAFFTNSGAMLAEALHSGADCGNQLLLLLGVRSARRQPDAAHPFGYGRNLYFWSFMVALMLFLGGGVVSIYEGIHKLIEPEPIHHVGWAVAILFASMLLEGGALLSNVREMRKRRKDKPFFRYLRETKDSDLIVVFAENGAAVLGLALALITLGLAFVTKNSRWDGVGSILIGIVLIAVAIFLAIEVQSLLVGEAADSEIETLVRTLAEETKLVTQVLNVRTIQQGPSEVLVAIKMAFASQANIDEVCHAINDFEARLRAACPDARWVFVEPDLPRL